MSTEKIKDKIEIPQGIEVQISDNILKIKGPKGTLEKKVYHPYFKIHIENNHILLEPTGKKYSKNEKRILKTNKAHINNFIYGVNHGYVYHLKIVSGHFPMNVAIEGNTKIIIKNFLGEKVPRVAKILPHVKASIKNDEITIEGMDKESVGQTAANLEAATRITNRDRRIFQDGIYITEKSKRII